MTLQFWLTSLIITATPGTGVLYTLAAAIGGGRRASIAAAFGCTLGIVPHLAAAVFGAAALLRTSGLVFNIIKYAGVAYLLYMAWSMLRQTGELRVGRATPASMRRTITSAVLVNLLNPKLTLFFFAFLPQFLEPGRPGQTQRMLALSGVFMAMTFVVFVLYGVLAAAVRDRVLSRPRFMLWVRRVFAASFAALSARLVVADR